MDKTCYGCQRSNPSTEMFCLECGLNLAPDFWLSFYPQFGKLNSRQWRAYFKNLEFKRQKLRNK